MNEIIIKLILAFVVGVLTSFAIHKTKNVTKVDKSIIIVLIIHTVIFFLISFFCMLLFILVGVPAIICSLIQIKLNLNEEETSSMFFNLGGIIFIITTIILLIFFVNYHPEISNEKIVIEKFDLLSFNSSIKLSTSCSWLDCTTEEIKVYCFDYTDSSQNRKSSCVYANSVPLLKENNTESFIGTYQTKTLERWPETYQLIYGLPPEGYSYGRTFKEIHINS